MKERGVVRCCPFYIRRERLYRVKPKTVLRREAVSDRRLATATAPSDESNVAKSIPERVEIVAEVDAAQRGKASNRRSSSVIEWTRAIAAARLQGLLSRAAAVNATC